MEKLFKRFLKNECSKEELDQLFRFINDPSKNEQLTILMRNHWKEADISEPGKEEVFKRMLDVIHHKINLEPRKKHSVNPFYHYFSKIAAILILPLLLSLSIIVFHKSPKEPAKYVPIENTISVPLGSMSRFILPDGTKVWLNSGSQLTYPVSFEKQKERLVKLDGEAYFEVYKDSLRSFIVDASRMDVKVLGTSFNIRDYHDEGKSILALLEGQVTIGKYTSSDGFEKIVDIEPNNVAEFNNLNQKIKIKRNEIFSSSALNSSKKTESSTNPASFDNKYTSWVQGVSSFNNDPIDIVTAKFEKLYNIEIIINDEELKTYSFTATFINESLERALKIISLSSPIKYTIQEAEKDAGGQFGRRKVYLNKKFK